MRREGWFHSFWVDKLWLILEFDWKMNRSFLESWKIISPTVIKTEKLKANKANVFIFRMFVKSSTKFYNYFKQFFVYIPKLSNKIHDCRALSVHDFGSFALIRKIFKYKKCINWILASFYSVFQLRAQFYRPVKLYHPGMCLLRSLNVDSELLDNWIWEDAWI